MTLYEEFGLDSTATPEQIRHAHRRMARLLHPDNFQDEEMRRLAECQMKRVNTIYGVLSDPQKRAQYDQKGTWPQEGPRIRHPIATEPQANGGETVGEGVFAGLVRRNLVWVLATLVCVYGVHWMLSRYGGQPELAAAGNAVSTQEPERLQQPPAQQQPRRSDRTASAHGSAENAAQVSQLVRETRELRKMLEQALAERDYAIAKLAALRSTPSIPALGNAVAAEQAPPESSSVAASPEKETLPVRASSNRMTGTWVYLPPTLGPSAGDLYPAEYIELVIAGQGRSLIGRYRARYRVADKAISPEVRFIFEGKSDGNTRFNWTGNGGARGEVGLKLLSDNTMSVDWYTSHFGPQMTLSSGTAVLIRRQEP
jgi:curved DNA-binding protein CbpA